MACACLLDEATAVAEAAALMARAARRDSPRRVVLDAGLHPQCLEVAAARCRALGIDVLRAGPDDVVRGKAGDGPLLGAVLAHTTSRGAVQDLAATVAAVRERGGTPLGPRPTTMVLDSYLLRALSITESLATRLFTIVAL